MRRQKAERRNDPFLGRGRGRQQVLQAQSIGGDGGLYQVASPEHVPESSIEILGHSVGGITYRHYAHRAPVSLNAIMTLPQPAALLGGNQRVRVAGVSVLPKAIRGRVVSTGDVTDARKCSLKGCARSVPNNGRLMGFRINVRDYETWAALSECDHILARHVGGAVSGGLGQDFHLLYTTNPSTVQINQYTEPQRRHPDAEHHEHPALDDSKT